MFSALARLAAARARVIVAVAAALTVLGFLFGGSVAGRLSSGGFSDPHAQSVAASDQLARAAGYDPDANLLVLVAAPAGALTREARREVARVVARLGGELGIGRVLTPYAAGERRLIARDGRSLLVIASGVREAQARQAERLFRSDPRVRLGGGPLISVQVDAIVKSDLKRAELYALPVLFLLSLWIFRGLVAALLPPLIGAVAIAAALAGLRAASSFMHVSVYALNLVTGMGLGLAIDYSLFIVSRYREELRRSGPGLAALQATLSTAGRTVFFSALTVAAALASLLAFPQTYLYSMGLGGMLVALAGAAVALIVLPALLSLLGQRVDALAPRRLRRAAEAAARPASSGFWYRLARLVMRRPLPIASAAAALLLALGTPFLGIRFTSFDPSVLPASASSRQVDQQLRSTFSPRLNPPVYLALSAPATAGSRLAGYASQLRQLPQQPDVSPARYLGASTWRIDLGTRSERNSAANQALVRELRARPQPLPARVGGAAALLIDQKHSLATRLPYVVGTVVLTSLIALFLMTGSLVIPIKALLLNLLTISAVFGTLVLVFQDGRLEGLLAYQSQHAIDVTQPLLIAVLAFALSTDYGVFLITRIKEARDAGADDRTAIALGLERTGRIVTAAALLFLVAIGSFASSRIVAIKEVGLGTGLAVLLDATIVRALLVPSLMRLLGRWNWWAPPPLRPRTAKKAAEQPNQPPSALDLPKRD